MRGTCDEVRVRLVSELQVLDPLACICDTLAIQLYICEHFGGMHASSCVRLHATHIFIQHILAFDWARQVVIGFKASVTLEFRQTRHKLHGYT